MTSLLLRVASQATQLVSEDDNATSTITYIAVGVSRPPAASRRRERAPLLPATSLRMDQALTRSAVVDMVAVCVACCRCWYRIHLSVRRSDEEPTARTQQQQRKVREDVSCEAAEQLTRVVQSGGFSLAPSVPSSHEWFCSYRWCSGRRCRRRSSGSRERGHAEPGSRVHSRPAGGVQRHGQPDRTDLPRGGRQGVRCHSRRWILWAGSVPNWNERHGLPATWLLDAIS